MPRLAFYDLDGTLCSGNVVQRYAFFARHYPSPVKAALKITRLVVSVPLLMGLDFYSRAAFNRFFYREYRGMDRDWLRGLERNLFEQVIRPSIYPGAKALVDSDRAAGFEAVLVTGELDFALPTLVRHFGFGGVISNSLVYENGREDRRRIGLATGEVAPPLIAGAAKVEAIECLCRERGANRAEAKAYSDSFSDTPMLESVGRPAAVNPDRRLRRVATARGWPILDLKKGIATETDGNAR